MLMVLTKLMIFFGLWSSAVMRSMPVMKRPVSTRVVH